MERLTEKVYGFAQIKKCGNDFCKETCVEHDEEKSCNNYPIQKAIEKLTEYEDLEEQGKLYRDWIPCSERLPEESLNSVIGWDEYRERCCFVQYYGGKWHFGNDDDPVKIIAWQSVPEPYKPEKERE